MQTVQRTEIHTTEIVALKPEGVRLIREPKSKWHDNIKLDLKPYYENVTRITAIQDPSHRLGVHTKLNLRVPSKHVIYWSAQQVWVSYTFHITESVNKHNTLHEQTARKVSYKLPTPDIRKHYNSQ